MKDTTANYQMLLNKISGKISPRLFKRLNKVGDIPRTHIKKVRSLKATINKPRTERITGFITTRGESPQHINLKKRATALLINMGCQNIKWEVELLIEHNSGGYNLRTQIDVLGEYNGQLIGVECGGLADPIKQRVNVFRQLLQTSKLAKLYILPYGESDFYEWDYCKIICNVCGHNLGIREDLDSFIRGDGMAQQGTHIKNIMMVPIGRRPLALDQSAGNSQH